MKTGIVIQARRASTRLPDKILLKLPYKSDTTVLENVIKRAKLACDNVIVATTTDKIDDLTAELSENYGALVFRGSMDDVLARYVGAAQKYELDNIVRITSDCPCIDPQIIKDIITLLDEGCYDYVSNVEKRTFPHGLDTEAFTFSALMKSSNDEKRPEIREHVTLNIRQSPYYRKFDYITGGNEKYSSIRVTLDTKEDYIVLSALYRLLGNDFKLSDIVSLYEKHEWLSMINSSVYQKKTFSNEFEEFIEAAKILKFNGLARASEKLLKK